MGTFFKKRFFKKYTTERVHAKQTKKYILKKINLLRSSDQNLDSC